VCLTLSAEAPLGPLGHKMVAVQVLITLVRIGVWEVWNILGLSWGFSVGFSGSVLVYGRFGILFRCR
jgi:hypothetical protein